MTALHHSAHKNKTLAAILLTCLAYACFNVTDAIQKVLVEKFYFAQVMVTSCVFTILLLGAYGAATQGRKAFRTKKPGLLALRAVITSFTSVCNLFALPHISLSAFYTLAFTSPLIVALLSAFFLKEKAGGRRLGVILFGFASIVAVFRPGGDLFNLPAALVLLGAFFYSCSLVLIRIIGTGESKPLIFMAGAFMGIVVAAPFLPGHFMMPEAHEWAMFVLSSAVGAAGVLCIAQAFQTAPSAATVAPYHYTQIVWGALLGWVIFREVPDARVMAGACAIIAAGLYLIRSETRHARVPDAETVVEV